MEEQVFKNKRHASGVVISHGDYNRVQDLHKEQFEETDENISHIYEGAEKDQLSFKSIAVTQQLPADAGNAPVTELDPSAPKKNRRVPKADDKKSDTELDPTKNTTEDSQSTLNP